MNGIRSRLLVVLILVSGSSAYSQDGAQTRSITSDDFVTKRPVAKSPGIRPKKKPIYRLSSSQTGIRRGRRSPSRKPVKIGRSVLSDIGVTIWKLRPGSASAAVTFPVKVEGRVEAWVAERVNSATAFREGDRVRLAVEPSTSGYLYVVNSEILADGNYDDPYLIFPFRDEGNRVIPGMLVDIPDQKDEIPYFNISAKDPNYRGEMLTVIVSPVPLTINAERDGKITNVGVLANLEIDADVSVFERTDDDDKVYTTIEADSSCGARSRMLVREKTTGASPCGEKTRQLTREEPAPQAVYRVKTTVGKPAVAFVKLNVIR